MDTALDPAFTTDVFVHVRIVMGTVIGLGITRLLLGVAGLVQHSKRAPLSLTHLLWCLSILIELVLFWWWEFELRGLRHWSFGIFAFLIGYSITSGSRSNAEKPYPSREKAKNPVWRFPLRICCAEWPQLHR